MSPSAVLTSVPATKQMLTAAPTSKIIGPVDITAKEPYFNASYTCSPKSFLTGLFPVNDSYTSDAPIAAANAPASARAKYAKLTTR